MPSPVTGTAVANASDQLRIIELDNVLDSNISTSMNFAIDFANQTFRMTGLQFTNWLSENLLFDAESVDFDNAIFQSVFPLEPTPPTDVQTVIDFGLPILANADAGNIGKILETNSLGDLDTFITGFEDVVDGLNVPSGNTRNQVISTISTSRGLQITADTTLGELNYRTKTGNIWGDYNNIFSSSTRTSAQANASLDLADTATQPTDLAAYLPLDGSQPMTGPLNTSSDVTAFLGGGAGVEVTMGELRDTIATAKTQAGRENLTAAQTLTVTLANPFADASSYIVTTSFRTDDGTSSGTPNVMIDYVSGSQFTIDSLIGTNITVGWIATALTQ